jgi:hypothetical protein
MEGKNRYEQAFLAWLRKRGLVYLSVDETQRHVMGAQTVKNPDVVVYGSEGRGFVVDVKGRRYPGGTRQKPRRVWEHWCTRQDCFGLIRWADALQAQALLVFVYQVRISQTEPWPSWLEKWRWRGTLFGLCGVSAQQYLEHMRLRSVKWDTVSVPMGIFRALARPASVCFGLRGDYERVPPSCSHSIAE